MPKLTVEENALYPVILHREVDTWGYFVPEFGGGGAPTQSDALQLAQELLNQSISLYFDENGELPKPPSIDNLDTDGGQVVFLPVAASTASERIFITLPKILIAKIDANTNNRSAFFAELARERLQETAR